MTAIVEQIAKKALVSPALATEIALWALAFFPDNAVPGNLFTVVVIACCLPLILSVIWRQRFAPRPRGIMLLIWFYFVVFLSTLAYGAVDDILSLIRTATLMVLLAWVAGLLSGPEQHKVLKSILLLGLAEAAIATAQKFYGSVMLWGWLGDTAAPLLKENPLLPPLGRAVGSFGHPIPLSLILAIAIVIALRSDAVQTKLGQFAYIAIFTLGIVESGTRSTVIVLVAVVVYMIYVQHAVLKRRLWRFFAAVGILVLLLTVDFGQLTLFRSLQGSISVTHREGAWDILSNLLGLSPLQMLVGNGWGSVARLASNGLLQHDGLAVIDNNIVAIVAIGGLIGLVLMAALILRGLKGATPDARPALLLIIGMFLSFDVTLWAAPMALLLVFAFGFRNFADQTLPESADGRVRRLNDARYR